MPILCRLIFWVLVSATGAGCSSWASMELRVAQAEEQERQLKKAVTGHLDSWIGRPVGSALDKAVTALLPRQWLENAPRISPTQPGYANIRIDESTGKIAPQTRLSQVQLHIQQEQGCLACHQR